MNKESDAALIHLRAWIRHGDRLCLMCKERDATDCHRSRIPEALGVKAVHL